MRLYFPLSALLMLALTASVACGGKQKTDGAEVASGPEEVIEEPVDMDEVDLDQLGDSPCGNPNWSRLPTSETPQEEPPGPPDED